MQSNRQVIKITTKTINRIYNLILFPFKETLYLFYILTGDSNSKLCLSRMYNSNN